MTDFTTPRFQQRVTQDYMERGVWAGSQNVEGAGMTMSVKGTGTVDMELPIVNFGYSFNLGSGDYDSEVIMVALGSDVNDKVAIPVLPRGLQYQWAAGTGGVQHPTDPNRRVEFNGDETWLKDGNYKLGNNKEVEVVVDGGSVTINVSGDTNINSSGGMNITTPSFNVDSSTFTHNGVNVGDDHVHDGVKPGTSKTQGPE